MGMLARRSLEKAGGPGALYRNPPSSARTGPLYNAFSYPTKISAETTALFIAAHTEPGQTVLDPFAGSGSTGLGALLCDKPTPDLKRRAESLGLDPLWGPRKAVLYEVGTLGALLSQVMCNPPHPDAFTEAATNLLDRATADMGWLYEARDPAGALGQIRFTIWSEILECHHCQAEIPSWKGVVRRSPLRLVERFRCPQCRRLLVASECNRVEESRLDPLLGRKLRRRKRVPVFLYGRTGSSMWSRPVETEDRRLLDKILDAPLPDSSPLHEIVWGDLHRSGYHEGITHLHHFYTRRNFLLLSRLWELAGDVPPSLRDSLRLLILSYNASHATWMTRVVIKSGDRDFIPTGAQSGVLYISGLPVEKNVLDGLTRKVKTFSEAFRIVHGSGSEVEVLNQSSTKMHLSDRSVDYVFTDPPFGDYIPYSEVNEINEAWLGRLTDREEEAVVSRARGRAIDEYGQLLADVFKECGRVLAKDGEMTVVFHSASSAVWREMVSAYQSAGFDVEDASFLDKTQVSFKQAVSEIAVQGDPMLRLRRLVERSGRTSEADILAELAAGADEEFQPRHLYSRYVIRCLIEGVDISKGAREFYAAMGIG